MVPLGGRDRGDLREAAVAAAALGCVFAILAIVGVMAHLLGFL
jgi:hypothetical protein